MDGMGAGRGKFARGVGSKAWSGMRSPLGAAVFSAGIAGGIGYGAWSLGRSMKRDPGEEMSIGGRGSNNK